MFDFLKNLFPQFNPLGHTKDWTRSPDLSQSVDFNFNKVCGLRIGDPEERISSLGSTESHSEESPDGIYCYKELGLQIDLDSRMISGFLIDFERAEKDFSFEFIVSGKSMRVSSSTTLDEIISLIGDPLKVVDENGTKVHIYNFSNVEYQFDVENGKFETLFICPPEYT